MIRAEITLSNGMLLTENADHVVFFDPEYTDRITHGRHTGMVSNDFEDVLSLEAGKVAINMRQIARIEFIPDIVIKATEPKKDAEPEKTEEPAKPVDAQKMAEEIAQCVSAVIQEIREKAQELF